MNVVLVGLDRIDSKSLNNFRERVCALIKRKHGGEDPRLKLVVRALKPNEYTGELSIEHNGAAVQYNACGPAPRDCLIDLLAQTMEAYRFSLTDLIKTA